MRLLFITSVTSVLVLTALPLAPANAAAEGYAEFGETVSLNPQPLPPRETVRSINLSDTVSLNPQPLPPKLRRRAFRFGVGDEVSLNPKPLPPRLFQYIFN